MPFNDNSVVFYINATHASNSGENFEPEPDFTEAQLDYIARFPFFIDLLGALHSNEMAIEREPPSPEGETEWVLYTTHLDNWNEVGRGYLSEREALLDFYYGSCSERFDTDLKQRLESDGHSATWVESPDCRRFDALLIRWKTGKGAVK